MFAIEALLYDAEEEKQSVVVFCIAVAAFESECCYEIIFLFSFFNFQFSVSIGTFETLDLWRGCQGVRCHWKCPYVMSGTIGRGISLWLLPLTCLERSIIFSI